MVNPHDTAEPTRYVVARIRQALAEDPRTHLLDVHVEIRGGKVFVLGTVESEERRSAAEAVIREQAPADLPIINELWVTHYTAPSEPERLP